MHDVRGPERGLVAIPAHRVARVNTRHELHLVVAGMYSDRVGSVRTRAAAFEEATMEGVYVDADIRENVACGVAYRSRDRSAHVEWRECNVDVTSLAPGGNGNRCRVRQVRLAVVPLILPIGPEPAGAVH